MAHVSANERGKVGSTAKQLVEAVKELRTQAKRLDNQLGRIESVARDLVSAEARQSDRLREKADQLQNLIDAGKLRLDTLDGQISGLQQAGRNLADRVAVLEEGA